MLAIPAAVQLLIINSSHEDGTVRKSAVSAAIPTNSSGWAESMLVGVTTRPWDVTRSAFALLQSLHWLSQGSFNSPFASSKRSPPITTTSSNLSSGISALPAPPAP